MSGYKKETQALWSRILHASSL